MKKFSIKQGVEAAMNVAKRINVLEINVLGCGGAFDLAQKHSSLLLKTANDTKILIDCGYTSYATLKLNNMVGDVDYVFITHTHDDHISGLSCFIYDRWFLHQKNTKIFCTKEVSELLKKYLFEICNHEANQVELNIDQYVFFENDNLSITKIDTTSHHFPNFPNSGFLFHFQVDVNNAFDFVYSGDIDKSILGLLPKENYEFLFNNLDNTFVFHDMTFFEYPGNPHCNFKLLKETKDTINKLITYHHNLEQLEMIRIDENFYDMAATSVLNCEKRFVIEKDYSL